MAQQTQLNTIATPGRVQAFSPKTAFVPEAGSLVIAAITIEPAVGGTVALEPAVEGSVNVNG